MRLFYLRMAFFFMAKYERNICRYSATRMSDAHDVMSTISHLARLEKP